VKIFEIDFKGNLFQQFSLNRKRASGGQSETFEKVSLWILFKTFQWSSGAPRYRSPLPTPHVKSFMNMIPLKILPSTSFPMSRADGAGEAATSLLA